LQTLLRERLPTDVFIEEIQRPNREETIRKLSGAVNEMKNKRSQAGRGNSLLDSDNPKIHLQSLQPLQPTQYVPPPPSSKQTKKNLGDGAIGYNKTNQQCLESLQEKSHELVSKKIKV